jgi:hypothetical protein
MVQWMTTGRMSAVNWLHRPSVVPYRILSNSEGEILRLREPPRPVVRPLPRCSDRAAICVPETGNPVAIVVAHVTAACRTPCPASRAGRGFVLGYSVFPVPEVNAVEGIGGLRSHYGDQAASEELVVDNVNAGGYHQTSGPHRAGDPEPARLGRSASEMVVLA